MKLSRAETIVRVLRENVNAKVAISEVVQLKDSSTENLRFESDLCNAFGMTRSDLTSLLDHTIARLRAERRRQESRLPQIPVWRRGFIR